MQHNFLLIPPYLASFPSIDYVFKIWILHGTIMILHKDTDNY